MDNLYHYLGIIICLFVTIKLLTHKKRNLPPSPFTLPIVGHFHLIKEPLYQSLAALSSKYGPILYLKLGSRRVLVVSSPSAVEECFTKNDIVFANRPRTISGDTLTYNYTVFTWAPYGPHWRDLRRLAVVEIFSSSRVQKTCSIREEEVANLVSHLFKVSANGTQSVDLKYLFSLLTSTVILRLVAGKRFVEDARDMEAEKRLFREFSDMFFPILGSYNVCDFFPVLRWIGWKGIEKNLRELHRRRDEYIQNLVDEIRLRKASFSTDVHEIKNPSLIEKLISLQEQDPNFCSNEVMKSMALFMFIAGTETSISIMQWAMRLLLNHPEVLQKARAEIISHVGDEHLLNDSDLAKLPYLRCIVNETLRLYPPAPTLLSHYSSQDCRVGGYEIPKGTMLLANAWAIHRDPSVWEEPTKFKPERFEGNFDEKELGKYLPFGLGRRACPGDTMAIRVVIRNFPPSPPSLPIIGHFHLLKRPIYLTLHNLCNKYGPILFLRFGPKPVLVISSPSAIEECFTKNDIIFSNRPLFPSRKVAEYGFTTLASCPYGQHWRNLRRLTATEIFSTIRLQGSSSLRTEEIHFLVKQLLKNSTRELEIESFFYILTFNIMMKLAAGQRFFNDDIYSDNIGDMVSDLRQMFSSNVRLSWSDQFPILRWLTFHRAEREIMKTHKKKDDFLQALLDMRRNVISSCSIKDEERKRLIIDVMLSLQESEPDCYTDEIIKGMTMVMLSAGTVTSTSTMECAVTHLISHPEVFKKAREEIDENIGQSQLLDDGDLGKLPYLHCIINETLRLGSTGPIIPPRESTEECTVGGYSIPRGTMLLVHAWALYNDPNLWEDPDMFKPERFQGSRVEGDRGGYKFIAFGLGRRQCPGEGLAMRLMALTLGTLIQCFEWKKANENSQADGGTNGALKVIFRPRETLAPSILNSLTDF
ncbi:Cytochrome P450 [Corchorus olitorius]|uniref:Cytochrome P450 n=1 Tax=Corchorus olitorius TaxID=93759 RepID=A0A1R3HJY3_9ROSI|nr:Cytochrome P450 [Corchorus olitorius]